MAKQFRFNLLIKKERAMLSEAVSFLNSYAKYVIVLTQIIVLFVFFIKIILDQTVIDLKESIDQKNQIILTAKEMIENNNTIALKLNEIETIINGNDFYYQTLKSILSNVPRSITINTISLAKNRFFLEGESEKHLDIQKMQIRLTNKVKKKVIVEHISKKGGIYYFKINILDEEQKS